KHIGGRINLFDAFTAVVLRDMPVPSGGTEERLISIWRKVQEEVGKTHTSNRRNQIDARQKCNNDASDRVMDPLRDETNRLLKLLKWDDLEIEDLTFSHVTCNWSLGAAKRTLQGQQIHFTLKQDGKEVPEPHQFLNEARQSGLAIALYLAGRS